MHIVLDKVWNFFHVCNLNYYQYIFSSSVRRFSSLLLFTVSQVLAVFSLSSRLNSFLVNLGIHQLFLLQVFSRLNFTFVNLGLPHRLAK